MCFNAKTSLFTFIIGILGSLLLIKYGNPRFLSENIVFGFFSCFIAMIQFMDFLFWIDLSNKYGINKIATCIGPLLNVGQPTILFLLKQGFAKKSAKANVPIIALNIVYALYTLTITVFFMLKEPKLVTGVKHGHLAWPWIKYANPWIYLIMLTINIFYLTDFRYSSGLFLIVTLFLYLSVRYFSYNIGELWCFFGAFIPFFMLFFSWILKTGPNKKN
jgi:hypothetical protein